MPVDKKILKAAASNLRKQLRTRGGKALMPETKPPVEDPAAKASEEEEEAARKRGC